MASNIVLKVNTDELERQAEQISSEIKEIEKMWNEISNTVGKSKGYWEGEASNLHQKYYMSIKEEMPKVLERLKEHPDDLLKMAGIYKTAEQENETVATSLPDDVCV